MDLRALDELLLTGAAAPGLAGDLAATSLPAEPAAAALVAAERAHRRSSRTGDATSPDQP